ncbi:hypothetical protein BFG51_12695 [Dietzia alimentaria]|nr:hypothetical protein BFG51_12695 [Dietzia alimentaria]
MSAADRLTEIQARADKDAEFCSTARTDVPALVAAVRAVLNLHKPVQRYLVWGFEERSWGSTTEAVEATECDPSDVTEWMQCAECARVEDGATGDGPAEVGYANADYPCPTARAVEAALGAAS